MDPSNHNSLPHARIEIPRTRIDSFISELWFLCRSFSRFSPNTHTIACQTRKDGIAFVLVNQDLQEANAKSAIHLTLSSLLQQPVLLPNINIFMPFQELEKLRGSDHDIAIILHSSTAMDGTVSRNGALLHVHSGLVDQELSLVKYSRERSPRMTVDLKQFNSAFNLLVYCDSHVQANAPQRNVRISADRGCLKVSLPTVPGSIPIPTVYCSEDLSNQTISLVFHIDDIRALLEVGLHLHRSTITLLLSNPYLLRVGNCFSKNIN